MIFLFAKDHSWESSWSEDTQESGSSSESGGASFSRCWCRCVLGLRDFERSRSRTEARNYFHSSICRYWSLVDQKERIAV